MIENREKLILPLLREIRSLIDKSLKVKLNLGDFTMPQTMIIYNLANHGKMKISELSEKMGLTNSTVSGIVDRLEDQGIVFRERSTQDRRVVYVQFTNEHIQKYQDLNDNLDKHFSELLASIPPAQMENIIISLNILKDTLANQQEMNVTTILSK
ncbi:MAG: hypothetical protein APF84_00985 [Gracilibacter sp. BRH_c7a]|nr:MAG: hypothetical protein APF84_00985 [Gracilibacter sp. BRH_c7a]